MDEAAMVKAPWPNLVRFKGLTTMSLGGVSLVGITSIRVRSSRLAFVKY